MSHSASIQYHLLSWRSLISAGVSFAILGALWWMISSGREGEAGALFVSTLNNTLWSLASLYIVTQLIQSILRAKRYQMLLLADGEGQVPALLHTLYVTFSRNMFVDMVPARVGELSYILMMNRGHQVAVVACVSSLVLSLFFDIIALGIMLLVLVLVAINTAQGVNSMVIISLGLILVIAVLILMLLYGVDLILRMINKMFAKLNEAWFKRLLGVFLDVLSSVSRIGHCGIIVKTLFLSLLIRIAKYAGLYVLFLAVTTGNASAAVEIQWWQVIPAFIAAEAAASLPVPSLMSFGPYEGGGLLVLATFGVDPALAGMLMFVIHLLSQVVDYLLGAVGLVGFTLVAGRSPQTGPQ
ncbi:MAG TPA: flippase-like domain-containing protein [Acidiferrobacteraceae bacterium]|nr:flippase-like domain-containing protein [Acidiferrobacteraceae bacterium]